ncbi:hypothetical protein GQ53DRAFT_753371 [Thozetella sp. PMI_491]|nr:hypothetical protein GQ53DRAFT_753371 [Thozetella sp. PMI_491]
MTGARRVVASAIRKLANRSRAKTAASPALSAVLHVRIEVPQLAAIRSGFRALGVARNDWPS